MRQCYVTVEKILYRDKGSGWTVFRGTVLRWSKKTKTWLPTRETHIFTGHFYCIFAGDRFEISAREKFHDTYGSQYAVEQSKREEPVSVNEIRVFLKQIKGMTPKQIEKVLQRYGVDTVYQIKTDAYALDFLGLDPAVTDAVREALLHSDAFERTMAFLLLHNMDGRLCNALIKKYGSTAVSVIEDNPYLPYMDHICDIRTSDRLWLDLGKRASDDTRCLYTTLAALRLDVERGNVFTRRGALKNKTAALLSDMAGEESSLPFTDAQISDAISRLEEMGAIVVDTAPNGDLCLYLKRNYMSEVETAKRLHDLIATPKRVTFRAPEIDGVLARQEYETGIKLAEEQRMAVQMALFSPVSILTGGPGTGKTQTVKAIVSVVQSLCPDAVIRLCAPTGKAAVRAAEVTGIAASTVHRAIGLKEFSRDCLKDGELKCDLLIVDEFSMADIHLCARLLDAMTPDGRILLIGDVNQLPGVGPGLVLHDLIASEQIPCVELHQIFRQAQSSRIVVNAHRIIAQTPAEKIYLKTAKKPGGDFYFIEESDPRRIMGRIAQSIKQLKSVYGYGQDDVQILSPIKNGDLGTYRLNQFVQHLHPRKSGVLSVEYEDREFFLHDKVIHTRNNYQLKVFNGEIGTVTEIAYTTQKMLKVTYADTREIWYSFSDLSELEPAWAITVHKMQGSECPVIILPVHELQGIAFNKNSIYTALTRAKKMVILIGSASAVSAGLRRDGSAGRESRLIDRIRTAMAS